MGVLTNRRVTGADGIGLDVRCWEAGADGGAPLLLVHGLASNARMWDGVARRLASSGHPVATVDQRGHGRSAKPDDGYDFATITSDLLAVLDHLRWEQPVVVGQSWGGNVVVELAARHPDTVAGIACIDGGWIELAQRFATWDACAAAMAPPVLTATTEADFRRSLRTNHPDWPEESVDGFMGCFEVLDDATVAPLLTRERHMRILRSLWEHRPTQRYAAVKVPVLLVPALSARGPGTAGSEWAGMAAGAAAAAIPNARLAGIVGDHDLHAHRPEQLAALLHSWTTDVVADEVAT